MNTTAAKFESAKYSAPLKFKVVAKFNQHQLVWRQGASLDFVLSVVRGNCIINNFTHLGTAIQSLMKTKFENGEWQYSY